MPLREFPTPNPDFSCLERVFRRQGEPDHVPFIEPFIDLEPVEAFLGRRLPAFCFHPREAFEAHHDGILEFHHRLGFDYMISHVPPWYRWDVPAETATAVPAPGVRSRTWAREVPSRVTTWEEFERFPWPKVEEVDFSAPEYCARKMPPGMKTIVRTRGVFGQAWRLMGYETFLYSIHDQPDLVAAIWDHVGEVAVAVCRQIADMNGVGAVLLGDDMGFKSGTLIHPDILRQHVFPWYRRITEAVHSKGLPLLLHSCGNLRAVMDDLIDVVGIDGKHSFEDSYLPAAEAKRLWGERVAILGGVDVDTLCRASEEELRAYVRNTLEQCAPGGGFALGSNNSLTRYIPLRNYLIMLEEGYTFGQGQR
ncbi:MAG: uroporphyrinogen decarboxylase family protein [Anaerolineae bacterium]